MKKSQLRNIIRESVKELLIEGGNCQKLVKVNLSDLRDETSKESIAQQHTWKVCSLTPTSPGTPIPVTSGGSINGGFSFAGLGPTSGPGVNATLAAFYPWVVSQVGPISVGDYITFDMLGSAMCTVWANGQSYSAVKKICLEYTGTSNNPPSTFWNGTSAIAVANDCCGNPIVGEGCSDPSALNFGECCNGNPLCVVIGSNDVCCDYPDPCLEPLWLAMPSSYKAKYCSRCKVPPYNGSWPVWLLNASFNPPPYYTDSFPAGFGGQNDYCDCCPDTPMECEKCCCEKDTLPMEQVGTIDPTDPSEPNFGGCKPGTTIQLSTTLNPCKCPPGTEEIPCKNKIKERFQKLANIK